MFQLSRPHFDANSAPGGAGDGKDLGDLPEWNLDDLYAGEEAPELSRDLEWLEKACASFAADYEGKLATLNAAQMLECIQRNEKIGGTAGRIMSFAGLRYYQQTTDGARAKFMSDCQEKITNFTTPLVFFTLELNRLDEEALKTMYGENSDLARYAPVIRRIRAMEPYQLSDELEKFLHDLGVVGDAWERLFDETIAGLSFEVDGESQGI
ncbi:MAG: oligoendopeptidase F, partial [Pseudomonadota bacterium]